MTAAKASGAAAIRSRPRNARHWVADVAANSSVNPTGGSSGSAVPRRSKVPCDRLFPYETGQRLRSNSFGHEILQPEHSPGF